MNEFIGYDKNWELKIVCARFRTAPRQKKKRNPNEMCKVFRRIEMKTSLIYIYIL